jgi:hypothetical protein
MKKNFSKTILLILLLSIFGSTFGFKFVKADLSTANSCALTQTMVVFDHYYSNWDHPAIATITIPPWPIESCYMEYKGRNNDYMYLRAITFWLDWRGGAIGCWRQQAGQVRGYGTIGTNSYKEWNFDMSNCQFAKNTSDLPTVPNYDPAAGSVYWNFIPEDSAPPTGYFTPGQHTIEAFISAQDFSSHQLSWITLILHFTFKYIPAIIDFDPDTLNPKSKGNWVTVYIEFPEDTTCDISNADISTILLNGIIPVEESPTGIGDHDEDGNPDLMVKFDRASVIELLEPGENVLITISGELNDGTAFEGTDMIRVLF